MKLIKKTSLLLFLLLLTQTVHSWQMPSFVSKIGSTIGNYLCSKNGLAMVGSIATAAVIIGFLACVEKRAKEIREKGLSDPRIKKLVGNGCMLVIVHKPGCGACHSLKPIIENIQKNYKVPFKITWKTPEEFCQLTNLQVNSFPSMFFYKGGECIQEYDHFGTTESMLNLFATVFPEFADHFNISVDNRRKIIQDTVDIAVIGSGAAGSTAARYCANQKLKTVVFSSNSNPLGSMGIANTITNFPGKKNVDGAALALELQNDARGALAQFYPAAVEQCNFNNSPFVLNLSDHNTCKVRSVIIATGSKPRYLGVENEEQYWGHSISPCTACDAQKYKGMSVVVVGNNDEAFGQAKILSGVASDVYLIVGSSESNNNNNQSLSDLNEYKNIYVYQNDIETICGDEKTKKINAIILKESNEKIAVNGIFVALGREPNNSLFTGKLGCDQEGYLKVNNNQQTTRPGIFACGDVCTAGFKSAVSAVSQGLAAAYYAHNFLSRKTTYTENN